MKKFRIVSIVLFLASLLYTGYFVISARGGSERGLPELSIEGELIEVSVNDGEQVLMQGVTATDEEDGDLTGSVMIESIGPFIEDDQRVITYAVIDSDNHVTHGQRRLVYSDYTPAQFTIESPLRFELGMTGLTYGIRATDCLDGDLTDAIRLYSEEGIDVRKPGIYNAEVRVTNSAGATSSFPITIEIISSALE